MAGGLLACLDPRAKLAAFLAIQALLFLPAAGSLSIRLFAVAVPLLGLLLFAGQSWRLWLRLLALAAPFLAFLVFSAALQPGAARTILPRIVLPLLGKSMLVFLTLALFILNEHPRRLLQALRQLGLPRSPVVILAIGHRFTAQWGLEVEGMRRAWTSRNLIALPKLRRAATLGRALPLFFDRLLENGSHVHDAMISRGFSGSLPCWRRLVFSGRDALFLALTAIVAAAIATLS